MGGFYGESIGKDDAEVENLLAQLQEESVLKLNINSHRSTSGFQVPSFSDGDKSLDGNLLSRFANLKSRPELSSRKGKCQELSSKAPSSEAGLKQEAPRGDGEVLDGELEQRLSILKTGATSSSGSLSKSFSLSPQQQGSRSFSPMKLIKQLSGGRKSYSKTKAKGSSDGVEEDGNGSHSASEANKLLASVVTEVVLEKKMKKNSKKGGSSSGSGSSARKGSDEEDSAVNIDELSLKDLDVKKLKRELSKASGEEEKLAREAAQVVEWAKDAARLDPDGEEDELEDLEELLKLEDEGSDEEKDEEDGEEDHKKVASNKKKKGKKWVLF